MSSTTKPSPEDIAESAAKLAAEAERLFKIELEKKYGKTILDRDLILNKRDMVIESLIVPEWEGKVFVRSLSGRERDDFELLFTEDKDSIVSRQEKLANLRARLCAMTLCNEQGIRLFTMADMELLGEKNASALDRIFDKARELSGLTKESVKTLEGNSGSGQS